MHRTHKILGKCPQKKSTSGYIFYCIRCRLIPLNNEATRRALQKPCPGYDPKDDD